MQNAKKTVSTTAKKSAPLTVPTKHNGNPYAIGSNGAFMSQLNGFLNTNNIVGGVGALTVAPNTAVVNTAYPLNNPLPTCSKIANGKKRALGMHFLFFGCPIVNGNPYTTKHADFGKYGYICPAQWVNGKHPATNGKKGAVSFNLAHCLNANTTTGLTDKAQLIVGLALNGGNNGNTTNAPLITLTVTPNVS
tara:strand:+ start:90 stop:665 length:576 start_codon:yes stop_codon:yes gene_type:complete